MKAIVLLDRRTGLIRIWKQASKRGQSLQELKSWQCSGSTTEDDSMQKKMASGEDGAEGSSGGWWEIILICIFDQTTPSTQIEELLKPNHIVFTVGKNYAWFEESTPKSNMSCIQNCHYLGLTNAQKWGQMRIYWNLMIGWKVQQSSLVWIHPQSLYLLDNPFEIYIQFMHTWSNNAVDGWFLLIYFPSRG